MKLFTLVFGLLLSWQLSAQTGTIKGKVTHDGKPLGFTSVGLKGTSTGTSSDADGLFELKQVPFGTHEVRISFVGFSSFKKTVTISAEKPVAIVNAELLELPASLDEVVVTGTRTARKRTESPVAVDVLSSRMFDITQSASLKDGLCFQPGLRVETNCQTCNYSQVRMNGLGGSYTQILINSRPIFSSLNGLYGLEQIPANMIDRVEIVRGGGSALYGSSAIAGTVNIITKDPEKNTYSVSMNHGLVGGRAADNQINVDASVVSKNRRTGLTFFGTRRQRRELDTNGDGFSELPRLLNHSFGISTFLKTTENAKLTFNLNSINEVRDGGDKLDRAPHERQQTEWRDSRIIAADLNYDISFRDKKSNLAVYAGAQDTKRDHYTGVDGIDGYGKTKNQTFQAGFQYNRTTTLLGGKNIVTLGSEFQYDDVFDQIVAYDYLIDQTTRQWGLFAQSDWELAKNLTALLGFRANQHNYVDKWVVNPRASLLYKLGTKTKIRASYANGFRAPQAFDTDMHMAFANGGVSRITLDPNLRPEYSNSLSASVDYDNPTEYSIWGYTISAFRTRLDDTFVLEEIGTDPNGNMQLGKINGSGSTVSGLSVEGRLNLNRMVEVDLGMTFQHSEYDAPVAWSADIPGSPKYLRTPNQYGYYTLTYTPTKAFNVSLSGVYTGPMLVPHFGGAPGVDGDVLFQSPSFVETNVKLAYSFKFKGAPQRLQLFGGVQNIFNQFQNDFDIGKFRDSNYIYGPSRPRTFYAGLKFGLY
jgi:outer membrane receptor for ferrienterochelin and colicins